MSQDNTQTTPQVDLMEIDALFRRIAERGRKVRNQAQTQVGDNEQASKRLKDIPSEKDIQSTKQAGK